MLTVNFILVDKKSLLFFMNLQCVLYRMLTIIECYKAKAQIFSGNTPMKICAYYVIIPRKHRQNPLPLYLWKRYR